MTIIENTFLSPTPKFLLVFFCLPQDDQDLCLYCSCVTMICPPRRDRIENEPLYTETAAEETRWSASWSTAETPPLTGALSFCGQLLFLYSIFQFIFTTVLNIPQVRKERHYIRMNVASSYRFVLWHVWHILIYDFVSVVSNHRVCCSY